MVRIITVGKVSGPYREIFEHYRKLLKRFVDLEHISLQTGGDLRRENPDEIKRREWKKIEKYLKGKVVILDPRGEPIDSRGFSKIVSDTRSGDVTFVVGGPLGLPETALKIAKHVISISNLTLSHEVAFCVLLEQIFRSFKTLSGERYDY